ncbi:FMN-binding protein [Alkaliphilus hydrothermalis]|uniref:Major membrane immunogen (Membrane-anchored lipoprotein) n=1 Tax=Alkaliphilus hydrothermalis TaxID=1482730 RepID=A0ABS2NSX6_9FIRM|nr:FMN-binding protein [Alkaliphilus hydrothermalis]MBM7616060.1 major membrane immunogen (membrane-anchored lipoprotein) [Alkaliphilus hydrothermalis]
MRKSRLLSLILVVAMILMMGVGCQPAEDPTPDPSPAPAPAPDPDPDPVGFEDGKYEAEGEVDERGWKPFIEITVADGKITEVSYDEINEEEQLKTEDEEYNAKWKEKSGVSAPEAYPQLEQDLIEKQNVEKVDAVTGATSSSESFKEMAKKALAKE